MAKKEITRGIDISSRRLDDLEKEFFKYLISGNNRDIVLDLGCGEGNIGISAGFLNKKSYMYDIEDYSGKISVLKDNFAIKDIFFQQIDLKNIDYNFFPKNITGIYAGRFLHYLTYSEAQNLIKVLYKNMQNGSKIFISVTGVNTEIAKGYDIEEHIEKRFAYVEKSMQERFHIKEKVTLYSKNELCNLFEEVGFEKEKVWENNFGNIKGIFVKK